MGILDWKPRWTLKGTREQPAFYKDEGRRSLHINGNMIREGEKMELMAVEEHDETIALVRKALRFADHTGGEESIIETAEVAATTYDFTKHQTDALQEEITKLRAERAPELAERLLDALDGKNLPEDIMIERLLDVCVAYQEKKMLIRTRDGELTTCKKVINALVVSIQHMAKEREVLDECHYAVDYALENVPDAIQKNDR